MSRKKSLIFVGLALEKGESGRSLAVRVSDILETKLHLRRRIPLRKVERLLDFPDSNAQFGKNRVLLHV